MSDQEPIQYRSGYSKLIFVNDPGDLPVGTPVTYFAVIGPNGPQCEGFESVVRSEPWQLSDGTWVVGIEGRSVCYLTHLKTRRLDTSDQNQAGPEKDFADDFPKTLKLGGEVIGRLVIKKDSQDRDVIVFSREEPEE